MLELGSTIRFTPSEIARLKSVGVDLAGVTSKDGFAREVEAWALTMGDVRPDVLDKLDAMLKEHGGKRETEK